MTRWADDHPIAICREAMAELVVIDRLLIREETPDDHPAIATVVESAFGSPPVARLVEAIRASDRAIPALSLVADIDGEVVGHVMISYVDLHADGVERRIASLSPLAVAPACHARGIGSALVNAVVERADQRGEPLVVLEGDPRSYGRLGFEHTVTHGIHIDLPSWAPPEAAQVRRIASYDPTLRGRLVYPPAFAEVTHHN